MYIYNFIRQLDLFDKSSHTHGFFQNKHNYVIEMKSKTTCNWELFFEKKLVEKQRNTKYIEK
jgi:hypothetical protein